MKSEKILHLLRKNWVNLLLGLFIAILLFNPNAKVWILQQIAKTGLFNAGINSKKPNDTESPVSFHFKSSKGDVVTNDSLAGKVVFINYWASWCPPCRAEMPSLQELYDKMKDNKSIEFLFVNDGEDRSLAIEYLATNSFTLPLYFSGEASSSEFFVTTLPTTYILNKNGVIVFEKTGMSNYNSPKFIAELEKLIAQ